MVLSLFGESSTVGVVSSGGEWEFPSPSSVGEVVVERVGGIPLSLFPWRVLVPVGPWADGLPGARRIAVGGGPWSAWSASTGVTSSEVRASGAELLSMGFSGNKWLTARRVSRSVSDRRTDASLMTPSDEGWSSITKP